MNRTQIHIKSDDVANGRLQVEQVLVAAARKFGLFDNTVTSRVPNTIKSLVEREGFGFGLGGRVVDDLIIVDFYPHGDTPQQFRDIYHDIAAELAQKFPGGAKEVREDETGYRPS
jgi:hypothetical protein